LKELEKAKELSPNEAHIYSWIGAVDRRTARFQEAETNFRRAVGEIIAFEERPKG